MRAGEDFDGEGTPAFAAIPLFFVVVPASEVLETTLELAGMALSLAVAEAGSAVFLGAVSIAADDTSAAVEPKEFVLK